MHTLIAIIVLAFVIGLLSRSKGDGFLDTLGSGCSTMVWIVILIIIAVVVGIFMSGGNF